MRCAVQGYQEARTLAHTGHVVSAGPALTMVCRLLVACVVVSVACWGLGLGSVTRLVAGRRKWRSVS